MINNASGFNKAKILRNSLVLYLRLIVSSLLNLFTVRILINTMGEVDYGIYILIFGLSFFISTIKSALNVSSQRFLSIKNLSNNINSDLIFGQIFFIYAFLGVIVLAIIPLKDPIIEIFLNIPHEKKEGAKSLFTSVVIITCFSFFSAPFQSLFFATENLDEFGWIGVIESFLKLVVAYSLISFENKLSSIGYLLLSIFILTNILYIYFALKRCKVKFVLNRKALLNIDVFNHFRWNFLSSFSNVINLQGQSILLNIFFGPVVNTSRGVSIQVKNLIYLILSNIQSVITTPLAKIIQTNETIRKERLINTSTKLFFFLSYIPSIVIITNCKEILNFWLSSYPIHTEVFVKLLLIEIVMISLSSIIETSVNTTENIKVIHYTNSILMVLSILISFILLRLGFSENTVYIVNLFCVLANTVLKIRMGLKILKIKLLIFTKEVLVPITMFVISTLTMLVPLSTIKINTPIWFFSGYFLFFIISLILFTLLLLNKTERNSLFSIRFNKK